MERGVTGVQPSEGLRTLGRRAQHRRSRSSRAPRPPRALVSTGCFTLAMSRWDCW